MFKSLNSAEAIKFKNGYLVSLRGQYTYESYEVSGVEFSTLNKVFCEDIDNIYKIIRTGKKLTGYKSEDGFVTPLEDLRVLQDKYVDEDGDAVYPDLETEYEHKKVIQDITSGEPVYSEPTETRTKIDVKVVGSLEDTGSDFITTAVSIGSTGYTNGKGVYQVRLSDIAKDEVLRHEHGEDKIELPTHSHLTYLKVNGEYVFTGDRTYYVNLEDKVRIVDNLEDAQVLEDMVRKYINNKIAVFLKSNQRTASLPEIAELYNMLVAIRTGVSKLDVKQKSYHGKNALLGEIRKDIERLEEMTNV